MAPCSTWGMTVVSRSAERRACFGRACAGVTALLLVFGPPQARADEKDLPYWLGFGHTVSLCPGAKTDTPFKIEGASWGVLASGVMLCRDVGDSYVLTLDYLNAAIDPADRGLIKREIVSFDWFGLALYRPGAAKDVAWLFDQSRPIKGDLRKDSTKRLVFGKLTFTVPKSEAEQASNMLFYLTFDGPLVALHAL